MKVSDMHKLRVQQKLARHDKNKLSSPLSREIQIVKEKMIREVLDDMPRIIKQQIKIAMLDVSEDGKNNDTVLKATETLINRAFGATRSPDDEQRVIQPLIILPATLVKKYSNTSDTMSIDIDK